MDALFSFLLFASVVVLAILLAYYRQDRLEFDKALLAGLNSLVASRNNLPHAAGAPGVTAPAATPPAPAAPAKPPVPAAPAKPPVPATPVTPARSAAPVQTAVPAPAPAKATPPAPTAAKPTPAPAVTPPPVPVVVSPPAPEAPALVAPAAPAPALAKPEATQPEPAKPAPSVTAPAATQPEPAKPAATQPEPAPAKAIPAAPVPPAPPAPPAQTAPSVKPEQAAPSVKAPATTPPPPAPPMPPAEAVPPKPRKSIENLFGRNIVGIVASVLVFLGLIFLGVLVVPYLSDAMKITGMFTLSTLLFALGFALERRYSNNFTHALLGTGLGAFYISILVTHLYFHALGDIAAFSLLAAWTAFSLYMAKLSKSLLVAILAHAGMVASVCAGYLGAVDDSRIVLLLVYQFVSSAIIVGGNILCCKPMYRFGLIATLALLGYSSLAMKGRFFGWTSLDYTSGLPLGLVAAAFIVQLLAATFLAYLLLVSVTRVKDTAADVALQLVNLALWFVTFVAAGAYLAEGLAAEALGLGPWFMDQDWRPLGTMTAVSGPALLMLAALVVLLRRKVAFRQELETATVVTLGLGAAAIFILNWHTILTYSYPVPALTLLAAPAAAWLALGRLGGNRWLSLLGRIALGLDAAVMLTPGQGYAGLCARWTVAAPIAYLAVLTLLAVFAWRGVAADFRRPRTDLFTSCLQLAVLASMADILWLSGLKYGPEIWLLVAAVDLAVVHFLHRDKPVWWYRAAEYALTAGIGVNLFNGSTIPAAHACRVAAAAICFAVFTDRIRKIGLANAALAHTGQPVPRHNLEYLTAGGMTVLFVGVLYDLTPWFDHAYPWSLSAMFVALIIITLGFWARLTPLRLYGLVVTVACVLKLVTFDIIDADTLMRVIAFIGGGLICFVISALYNFAVKRVGQTQPATPAEIPAPVG